MASMPDQAMDPSRRRRARVAGLAAAALAALSAGFVLLGRVGWLPFATWLAALLGLAIWARAGSRERARRAHLAGADVAALAAVTALAAFFRLHAIGDHPYGFWLDELWNARNAMALAAGGDFAPFGTTPLIGDRPAWVRTHNLYLYFSWSIQLAAGSGGLGVKLVSVAPGILAVPIVFLIARSLMGRSAAVAAGGLFAASLWHVTLSMVDVEHPDQVCNFGSHTRMLSKMGP